MDKNTHENKRAWVFLQGVMDLFLERKFNLEAEPCSEEGPCLVIANHVSSWDPILLARSFRKTPVHYVASEHVFRWGFLSRVIEYLLAPIPRRKASAAADTVMKCMRRLKAGQTVGLFAEGEATWDGVNIDIFSATGKLARTSGAKLVTYRIEGAYLSRPRWTKKMRRGKVRCTKVGVYSPEELRKMKPEEITALINRDIYENAWERQRVERVKFKARNRAEGIETGFYICPKCEQIGGIKGVGDHVRCACGFDVFYTEEGFFEPAQPFENLQQWNAWQREKFMAMDFADNELMFCDGALVLKEISAEHGEKILAKGKLSQYPDAIGFETLRFAYADIDYMSMVKMKILLFTVGDKYYEIRSKGDCCLRKYLAAWDKYKAEQET